MAAQSFAFSNVPRAQQFIFHISLITAASEIAVQGGPTLAAGDFEISIDGGNFANLATIPATYDTDGLTVTLSAAEMDGADIYVRFEDKAGAEWDLVCIHISTAAPGVTGTTGSR